MAVVLCEYHNKLKKKNQQTGIYTKRVIQKTQQMTKRAKTNIAKRLSATAVTFRTRF